MIQRILRRLAAFGNNNMVPNDHVEDAIREASDTRWELDHGYTDHAEAIENRANQ